VRAPAVALEPGVEPSLGVDASICALNADSVVRIDDRGPEWASMPVLPPAPLPVPVARLQRRDDVG
jgi:hypothetical protein